MCFVYYDRETKHRYIYTYVYVYLLKSFSCPYFTTLIEQKNKNNC